MLEKCTTREELFKLVQMCLDNEIQVPNKVVARLLQEAMYIWTVSANTRASITYKDEIK